MTQSGSIIRVVVVDDHRVVADALCGLIDLADDLEVVGRVYQSSDLEPILAEARPDVVVCDLEMPGGDPLAAIAERSAAADRPRVIVLTAFPNEANIHRAARIGVEGFLSKHEPADDVIEGIRTVAAGFTIASDDLRELFLEASAGDGPPHPVSMLSIRELAVVRLVAEGLSTPEVARATFRSPRTVEKQISSAMLKANCSNRVELTRWALHHGLVQA